jgi:EAL domain-containing protein (putative c-di-GMP-specific phosphodiesterase class I)
MNGDEFAVLFDAPMTQEEIEILARYFFEVISEEPFPINKSEVSVSVTLGLSTCSKLREIASEKDSCSVRLVINADVALKKAKEMKKHFLVYEESMKITQEYEHNVKWTKKILSAIKENRIVPYFQPIINNETGVIEKYETLIRLVEIDGTVISPGLFLEPAKKSRLYCYLTRIVIMKAFDYFENINKEFSINISVDDILDDSTNRVLMNRLKEYKNNKNVIFEIIESEGIESYIKVIEFIQTIKLYGCKIAIDDFGSGYSNFEHILRLNVDYLKIDGGMIKNIDKDMNSFIITETIVDFAKKMGIKTVAEFVHNEGVFNKVKELGVDYSQGYYFGEPKPSTGRDDYN